MGAIVAELHVDGRCFTLIHAAYGVSQATDGRGRVRERVRSGKLELVLDVPAGTELLRVWAFHPSKRYAVDVVFRDSAGGRAVETASLAGAYCVCYREDYRHGEGGHYTAELHLSDPDGLTMKAGSPGAAFVAPAPGARRARRGCQTWCSMKPQMPPPRGQQGRWPVHHLWR